MFSTNPAAATGPNPATATSGTVAARSDGLRHHRRASERGEQPQTPCFHPIFNCNFATMVRVLCWVQLLGLSTALALLPTATRSRASARCGVRVRAPVRMGWFDAFQETPEQKAAKEQAFIDQQDILLRLVAVMCVRVCDRMLSRLTCVAGAAAGVGSSEESGTGGATPGLCNPRRRDPGQSAEYMKETERRREESARSPLQVPACAHHSSWGWHRWLWVALYTLEERPCHSGPDGRSQLVPINPNGRPWHGPQTRPASCGCGGLRHQAPATSVSGGGCNRMSVSL